MLSSGKPIRQDFRTSTRFVFFDTGNEHWQYATHGGILFVIVYEGKPYGITCRHVRQDFQWSQIVVTNKRFGRDVAGLKTVAYPSQPKGAAVDTDLMDVAVIKFADGVKSEFFEDTPYLLDANTTATSETGDTLHVSGALKSISQITEDIIAPKFCLLEMLDDTPVSSDPTLRRAIGKFDQPEFDDVVGLSGSPVFNVDKRSLCGMVVRGKLQSDFCALWYVDILDIMKLLAAVHHGRSDTYYQKRVARLTSAGGI